MAGDAIKIPAGAYMMIHNPAFSTWGSYTSEELIKMSETLKTIKEGIINVYVQRTGKTRDELSSLFILFLPYFFSSKYNCTRFSIVGIISSIVLEPAKYASASS